MSDSAAAPAEAPAIDAKVEDAGPCLKKMRISVPPARVDAEIDGAFLDLIRTVRVPGFRPGHLPRKVAELRYGKAVREEVRRGLMEKAYEEALERHGLSPLAPPELPGDATPLEPGKPLEFELTVEVRPEIAIPDLKTISVKKVAPKVEEKDVERALEDVRLDRAELKPAEDGVFAERDVAVLDAAVVLGGERIVEAENVQYRHPSEVVAGISVPGVAKAMLGKKTDQELSLKIVLPGNFRVPEHAGKEAEIKFTIREVKRFHLPPLDEEFARGLDFDDVKELREEIRKQVVREKEAEAEKALDAAILDAILEKAPVQLPEGIVKREIGQVLSRYQADLHMQGASQEVIDEKLAEIQGDAAEHVAREFRAFFFTDEFAKKKGIFVTEGEVAEQISIMSGRYGKAPDEMRKYMEQRDLMGSLRGRLRERKVLEALRKEVKIS
jgi:trigger factor